MDDLVAQRLVGARRGTGNVLGVDRPRLEIEGSQLVHAAMLAPGVAIVPRVRVHAPAGEALADVCLDLRIEPELTGAWLAHIAEVAAGATYNVVPGDAGLPAFSLHAESVWDRTERVDAELIATLRRQQDGEVLVEERQPIAVLPFQEWPGARVFPELLAAFVTPNLPAVTELLRAVARHVAAHEQGDGALDGYQRRSAARSLRVVESLYACLQAQSFGYVGPPASFETEGQRVRTAEEVLRGRLGTCLDFVVLGAAALEQAGLRPVIVLSEGHAALGAWLLPLGFREPVVADPVRLRKRVDLGELVVFDVTAVTRRDADANPTVTFEAACRASRAALDEVESFVCAIDVATARREGGVRPLPLRARKDGAQDDGAEDEPLTIVDAPTPTTTAMGPRPVDTPRATEPGVTPTEPDADTKDPTLSRLDRFRNKLLDLSLHNRLLNFKATRKTMPLQRPVELAVLEDALAQGRSFRIEPVRPLPESQDGTGAADPLERHAEALRRDLRDGVLRVGLRGQELGRRLVDIARGARTALEESGANTLFLAIGMLRWFESDVAREPRSAPILLLPLEIERSSQRAPFSLRLADDEPRVNESLLAKLQADFGIAVRGADGAPLAELPTDDLGVDVPAILQAFRIAVRDIDRWEVVEDAWVGLFSFTKFLMWNDLVRGGESLLDHPLLNHLVFHAEREAHENDPGDPEILPDAIDSIAPADLLMPLDADSSQTCAVLAATGVSGPEESRPRSFVLEGPPGTGKSQTITNLIAHALAQGKRVLFVADKRAALEVVQRRLESVGLGEFCLALHSNKASKRSVVEALGRTLDVSRGGEPSRWETRAAELDALRGELNEWVAAMHAPRACGLSAFEATSRLIALGADATATRRVRLGLAFARGDDPVGAVHGDDLNAMRDAVSRLAVAGRAVGPVPAEHPFHGVGRADWEPALVDVVRGRLEALESAVQPVADARAALAESLHFDEVPDREVLDHERRSAQHLTRARRAPAALAEEDDREHLRSFLEDTLGRVATRDATRAELESTWKPGAAELEDDELTDLEDSFRRRADSPAVLRWFFLRGARRRVAALRHDGRCPPPLEAADGLALARRLRAERAAVREAEPECRRLLGAAWQDGRPDPAAIQQLLAEADALREIAFSWPRTTPTRAIERTAAWAKLVELGPDVLDAGRPLGESLRAFLTAHDELARSWAEISSLLCLDATDPPGALAHGDGVDHLGALRGLVRAWTTELPRLRDWCHYKRAADAAEARGLAALVFDHLLGRGTEGAADLTEIFERSFLEEWLHALTGSTPRLRAFHGLEHQHKIERFRELDLAVLDLAAQVVRARLAARVPRVARDGSTPDASEVGILLRELKKQRRHLPVRVLFERIPHLLTRIAPCLLMSPLSVAQYLDPSQGEGDSPPFDLVVFDEASQVRFWDAMGAIARARHLVVVGDSRQLPPTDFFNVVESAEDDLAGTVDIDDYDDLESLLDECVAAGMPRMHLRWHYRSRHESLITFSNHHYYENGLLTFPSPDAEHPRMGVHFVYVDDGVYDRGRSQTNAIEARRVVDEIVQRLRDPIASRRSLGVVTFSLAQQTLVQDLLDAARNEYPEIERHFSDAVEEPVLVKNLESVQGDERDVVLFSIGYGPDARGRVHMAFGPLNRAGGERRLNVAVTRAREELVVFSSIRADQIDLTRTRSVGARHLKTFLDYAARGVGALAEAIERETSTASGAGYDSPFEREVAEVLTARGHEIHRQVGAGGYRIDLAVVDPDRPGRYLLGIECDGATYHSAATARDRDRLRAAVLSRLGWQLHRVWSTDWWQFPKGEIERIEEAIRSAAAELAARDARRSESSVEVDTHAVEDEAGAGDEPETTADDQAADTETDGPDAAATRATPEASSPATIDSPAPDSHTSDSHTPDPHTLDSGPADPDAEADDQALTPGDVSSEADPPRFAAPSATTPESPTERRQAPFEAPAERAPIGDPDAFYDEAHGERVLRALTEIVVEEGPVVHERAARRLAARFEVTRMTSKARERFAAARDRLVTSGEVLADPDEDVLWPKGMDPSTDRTWRPAAPEGPARPLDEVPLAELAACAEATVQAAVALPVHPKAKAIPTRNAPTSPNL